MDAGGSCLFLLPKTIRQAYLDSPIQRVAVLATDAATDCLSQYLIFGIHITIVSAQYPGFSMLGSPNS